MPLYLLLPCFTHSQVFNASPQPHLGTFLALIWYLFGPVRPSRTLWFSSHLKNTWKNILKTFENCYKKIYDHSKRFYQHSWLEIFTVKPNSTYSWTGSICGCFRLPLNWQHIKLPPHLCSTSLGNVTGDTAGDSGSHRHLYPQHRHPYLYPRCRYGF